MSTLLDKHGFTSIENRLVYFTFGSPTNPHEWEYFKKLPELLKTRKSESINIRHIERSFSPVADQWSLRQMHSSVDRFKMFCIQNNIEYIDNNTYEILVRLKPCEHDFKVKRDIVEMEEKDDDSMTVTVKEHLFCEKCKTTKNI